THPSELQPFVQSEATRPSVALPGTWAVGIASALVASALTVLVLVAFGAIGERTRRPETLQEPLPAGYVVDYAQMQRVADKAQDSILVVRVTIGDTVRSVTGLAVDADKLVVPAHLLASASAMTVSLIDSPQHA